MLLALGVGAFATTAGAAPGAPRVQDGQPEQEAGAEEVSGSAEDPERSRASAPEAAPEPLRGVLGAGGENRVDYRIRARLERVPEAGERGVEARPEQSGEGAGDDTGENAGEEGTAAPGGDESEVEPSSDPVRSPDREHYTIDGTLTLRLENRSTDTLDELWFHVYWNAFSNNRSDFLAASRGRLRGVQVTDEWGFTVIDGVRRLTEAGDGVDLTPSLEWRPPGVAETTDRTVFRVDLDAPLPPGGVLEVEVDWRSVVPRVRRRTGSKDDFLLIAHWFPKLGVYESGRGWNCHTFQAATEFYADYGSYDVVLDLPGEFADRVFGSGERALQNATGDRVEVIFRAPSEEDRVRTDPFGGQPLVHGFTWTADPDFEVTSRTFRFEEWAEAYPEQVERAKRAFGPEFSPALREVTVDVLIQPERKVQAERHYRATAATLFFYGLWFGEYPFERITVVDPAWGGGAARGMEYPTLFTAGTRLFTREHQKVPEGVTIHECGHQWFYGLVGNNEFEAAWLDEGFNSWADAEVEWIVYGDTHSTTDYAGIPVDGVHWARFGSGQSGRVLTLRELPLPSLSWLGLDLGLALRPVRSSGFLDWWREQPLLSLMPRRSDPRESTRAGYLRAPDVDPIDTWGWRCRDVSTHRTNAYSRTATVVRSLPALIAASVPGTDGDAALLRGMRHYATAWRYAHPYPDDFFASFQEGAGVDIDLDPFFEELFRGTGTVDWSVGVQSYREAAPKGFEMGTDGEFAAIADEREDVRADADDDDEKSRWVTDVVVLREGALALPVEVELTWDDGESERFVWTRAEQLSKRWLRTKVVDTRRLVSAEVDPDGGYWLDTNRSNNAWYDEHDRIAPVRWAERAFTQLCQRLHGQKGLGG